jgi:predicted RNase H-like HicB family nuclease
MLKIETEREEDDRWIAEVPALPGVLVYGVTEAVARSKVQALALRVIADRLDSAADGQTMSSRFTMVTRLAHA